MDPFTRHDRREVGEFAMVKTADDLLRRAVLEEFAWDALVDESGLDVSVEDGVVTIVGTVPSLAMKLAAERAVLDVAGVRDVADCIEVKVPADAARSDAELADVVRHVLAWDALVPERHVDVAVADGWVTLSGETPTVRQRDEAARAVGRLAGVRGVTNHIVIERGSLGPDEVRTMLENAMTRRAAHRANRIEVVVDDGRVTLVGPVQSEAERLAILGAVGHGVGVTAVCDELHVAAEQTEVAPAGA